MMNHASPTIEHENEGHSFDDTIEESFQAKAWCCFMWNRANDGETKGLLGEERETWLDERLRKAKEVSELLAGPKWKNFIRKFSKQRKMKKGQLFQYDPQSYALNFNDNVKDENDRLFVGFSARFVIPVSAGECGSGL